MLGFMQPAVGDGGANKRLNIFVQRLEGATPVGEPRQVTRESARRGPPAQRRIGYFWTKLRRSHRRPRPR